MNEHFPEQQEGVSYEQVLDTFRTLKAGGVEDIDALEDPHVQEAHALLDAWVTQEEVKAGENLEHHIRLWVLQALIPWEAGFRDAEKNRNSLSERIGWLIQNYDEAREEKLPVAEEILSKIHEIQEALGEQLFDPAQYDR